MEVFKLSVEDWWDDESFDRINYFTSYEAKVPMIGKFSSMKKSYKLQYERVIVEDDGTKRYIESKEANSEINIIQDPDQKLKYQERKIVGNLIDPVSNSFGNTAIYESFILKDDFVSGSIETKFKGHTENYTWKKNNDEFYVEKYGEQSTSKGKEKYHEIMTFDKISKVFVVEIVRDNLKIEKKKKIYKDEAGIEILEVFEVKDGDGLFKTKNLKIIGNQIILEIKRNRREEKMKKRLVKKGSNYKEEFISIKNTGVNSLCPNLTIGKYILEENHNNYRVSWIMTDSYFFGKSNAFNNQQYSFNYYDYTEKSISEVTDFRIGLNEWGIIENYEKSKTSSVRWSGQRPNMHSEITQKNFSTEKIDQSQIKIDKKKCLNEYKQQANDLFIFTGIMKLNKVPKPFTKKNHLKKVLNYDRDYRNEQIDNSFALILKNSELNFQVMKVQKLQDLIGRFKGKCNKLGEDYENEKISNAAEKSKGIELMSDYYFRSNYMAIKQFINRK